MCWIRDLHKGNLAVWTLWHVVHVWPKGLRIYMASIKELTIWIDANLIEAVEEYAQAHDTTLQDLIPEILKTALDYAAR